MSTTNTPTTSSRPNIDPGPLTPISRAEARRRFTAARKYTVVLRNHEGDDLPVKDAGTPRTIERVTSSGVYIAGTPWAVTRLDEGDWATDDAGRLHVATKGGMHIAYDLAPLPLIDEALHDSLAEYAHRLRAAGFAVYLDSNPRGSKAPRASFITYGFFHYSREVDGRTCYGTVSLGDFGGEFKQSMPLTPSRLNGSGAYVRFPQGVEADSVEAAEIIASPYNWCPWNAEPTREAILATDRAYLSHKGTPQKYYKGARLPNAVPDGIGSRFIATTEV